MRQEAERQCLVAIQSLGGPQCWVCGRLINKRQWRRQGTCDRPDCRERHAERKRAESEQQRRIDEDLRSRLGALRDEVAGAMRVDRPARFAPVAVPAFRKSLTFLPFSRRRAFRDRLVRLIREAFKHPAPPADWVRPVHEPNGQVTLLPLASTACGVCRGFCCRRGGDHAFVDTETIRRYMSEHPTEQASDVFDAYLSKLADHTFEGSCVCHGESGCVLPADMRPEICTWFECMGLKKLRVRFDGTQPHCVFLAALDDNRPVRFAFLSSPSDGTSLRMNFGRLHGQRL